MCCVHQRKCGIILKQVKKSSFWGLCIGGAVVLIVFVIYTGRKPLIRIQNQVTSQSDYHVAAGSQLVPSQKYASYDPMQTEVPLPFLKDYRNPCFLQELVSADPYSGVLHDRRLKEEKLQYVKQIYQHRIQTNDSFRVRCFPSFFIAGVQKCGTTDLQQMMSLHQQVANFSIKEIHWWNRGRFQAAKIDQPITMEGYLDLFDASAEQIYRHTVDSPDGHHSHPLVFGDTSPALLWDQGFWKSMGENVNKSEPVQTVAHVIRRVLPQAKFVIILRNPTDRLYSDWQMFGNARFLKSLSPTRFHEAIVEAVNEFDECTLTEPLRTCFYDLPYTDPKKANHLREVHPWWSPLVRLRMGLYYIFIKDLLDVFPRSQVFVFRLEDYSKDRLKWLQDIFSFLGLDPDPTLMQKVKFERVHNQAKQKSKPMIPETRELLDNVYGEYNAKLAQLLQDDGYLWKRETIVPTTQNVSLINNTVGGI